MAFAKDDYVKLVDVNGDYRFGYIQKISERGYHFLVCTHEEGISAVEYDMAAGAFSPDWKNLLSAAEKSLIPLLAEDLTNTEIAEKLSVSPVTVRSQVRTLRLKLQLQNRVQLVALAQGMTKRLEDYDEGTPDSVSDAAGRDNRIESE